MPALFCDLRAQAGVWAHEYESLSQAGEAVALFWPHAAPLSGMRAVASAEAMEAAFEDECLAYVSASPFAVLPQWLPVEEFHRVLLCSDGSVDAPLSLPEAALVRELFAAGCEAVERLGEAALADLAQSWHSGRRAGGKVLTGAAWTR